LAGESTNSIMEDFAIFSVDELADIGYTMAIMIGWTAVLWGAWCMIGEERDR